MNTSKWKYLSYTSIIPLKLFSGFFFVYFNISGCDSIQQTDYKGTIQGWIYEETTRQPITGVNISSTEFSQVVLSGDTGVFILRDLHMGTSEHFFQIRFSFYGYRDTVIPLQCRSGEITKTDSLILIRDSIVIN